MFVIPNIRLSKIARLGLSLLAALAALPAARAQITSDAQIPFSFSSPTLMSPRGVAVALNGTVYVADPEVGVVQITPATGTVGGVTKEAASIASTGTLLNTTLTAPTSVAVDSNGNLYAADSTGHKVIELPAPVTTSTAVTITYGGTETPTALAVDPNNNLYIADEDRQAIFKVVGGAATNLNITIPGSCFLIIFCNPPTPPQPLGLAADANGDVYFANDDNTVYEYNATTRQTAAFLANPNAGNWEFSANAAKYPIGMGFDPAGDLYVMDSGSGNLIEITSTTNFQLPLSSASTPEGLAVSSIGNLYISDVTAETADEVFYNNNPFNFGSVLANTNTPAVTVNFQFNSHGHDLADYQSIQGDITTEFQTSSATCPGTTGSTCSMAFYVDYSSTLPGVQNGLVGLADTNSGAIYAVPNTGVSLASNLALYPGTQVALPTTTTLYEPQGLAVTGNGGKFFVADEGGIINDGTATYKHGSVWEYAVATAGTPGGTPTKIGTDTVFPTPDAVALDGESNLYVADYSGTVTKIAPSYSVTNGVGSISWPGKGTALKFPTGAALNHPMALALDPSGNLYIGDMGPAGANATASQPGYIVEVPANGGPAVKLNYTLGGVPIVFPQALTTDSQGNLYIADAGDQITDEGGVDIVVNGTVSSISFGNFAPLSQPSGLGFDAANDLYVLDGYNQRVLVVPVSFATGSTVPNVDSNGISLLGQGVSGITSAIVTPSNLVVWPGGQYLTVSDIGFQPATGAANPVQILTLQAVNATVGASSGSASVTGVNVGNEEITFAPPTSLGNSAFTLSGCGSTSGSNLLMGITAKCTTTIAYTPTGTTSQIDIFTLNGNLAADGSALGNQITVSGESEQPVGVWSGGGQQPSQLGDTVTLTNTGVLPLNISAVGHTNGSVGGVTDLSGTCTLLPSLTQNLSCTVTFSFSGANDNATINVTDNSGGVTGTVQPVSVTFGPNPNVQPALSLPADDVPRNLLDHDTSNGSNNSNTSSDSTDGKGGKKIHQ